MSLKSKLSSFLSRASYFLLGGALIALAAGPLELAYAYALASVIAMTASSILNLSGRLLSLARALATGAPLFPAEPLQTAIEEEGEKREEVSEDQATSAAR